MDIAEGEKSEKPTAKKKDDERKKGNIPMSKDFMSVAALIVGFFALRLLFPYMYNSILKLFLQSISNIEVTSTVNPDTAARYMNAMFLSSALIVGPIMGIGMLATVAPGLFQSRLLFAKESLKFDFSKMNPFKGIKRIFSLRSYVELLKNLIKVAIIGYVLYTQVMDNISVYRRLMLVPLSNSVQLVLSTIMNMVFVIGGTFVIIAMVDLFYQRWQHNKDLMMTKHEVKEEYKQMEGDPKVKGKIKERQQKMAMSRMMQSVPTADVVVRNPTHFAVALRYDDEAHPAPIVVAKGADLVAFRIIKVAEENGVMIEENKPLARGLYEAVDIEAAIPFEFYGAVAELLAVVYAAKGKGVKS